jgi:hypothetical protein
MNIFSGLSLGKVKKEVSSGDCPVAGLASCAMVRGLGVKDILATG